MSDTNRISLGFGGLHASPGDHIGHFYSHLAESRDSLVPFLRTGLEEGDKCVCVRSPGSEYDVLDALDHDGADIDAALRNGQLRIFDGETAVDAMRQALQEAIDDVRERFRILRWVGDMTWSVGKMPDSLKLMEWESACNVVDDPPAVFLCQYDLNEFRGNVVFDALKTHPLCIIGDAVRHNPYYVDPEAFLKELRLRASESRAAGRQG